MLAVLTIAHSPAHLYCDQFADLSSKPCTRKRPAVRALNLCENKVGDAGGATLIAAAHAATDLCVESSRAPLNATLSSALAARRDAQRSGALRVEL